MRGGAKGASLTLRVFMGLFSASAITCDQEFFFNQCFNLGEENERLIASYFCI